MRGEKRNGVCQRVLEGTHIHSIALVTDKKEKQEKQVREVNSSITFGGKRTFVKYHGFVYYAIKLSRFMYATRPIQFTIPPDWFIYFIAAYLPC